MTENQMYTVITLIIAMTFMMISFIALVSGKTFGSILAGLGCIYFAVISHNSLVKQKYDQSGKPV